VLLSGAIVPAVALRTSGPAPPRWPRPSPPPASGGCQIRGDRRERMGMAAKADGVG
jgi:hypothetical protein